MVSGYKLRRGGGRHRAVFKTQRRRKGEKGRDGGRVSVLGLLWDFLPHLKDLQIPLLWWWKRLVLSRSEACLPFCPLLASLPLRLQPSHPSSHSPSWVLLKSLRATICPRPRPGERRGEFHSVKPGGGGGGSPQGPEVPLQSGKWPGAIQFHTEQHKHKYVIVFIPGWLLPIHRTDKLVSHSGTSLPDSLTRPVSFSVLIRPVGPHFTWLPGLRLFRRAGPRARAGTGGTLLINRGDQEAELVLTANFTVEGFDNSSLLWLCKNIFQLLYHSFYKQ